MMVMEEDEKEPLTPEEEAIWAKLEKMTRKEIREMLKQLWDDGDIDIYEDEMGRIQIRRRTGIA